MKNFGKSVREKTYSITGGKCFYCGCELDFENFQIDHFAPRSNGGKDSKNRVPACCECNAVKTDKSIEEFRKTISGYVEELHSKMINKYMGIDVKEVKFYFEDKDFKPI